MGVPPKIGRLTIYKGELTDFSQYLVDSSHLHCQSTNNTITITQVNENEPRHDKTNKMSVRPAKTQISLSIPLV